MLGLLGVRPDKSLIGDSSQHGCGQELHHNYIWSSLIQMFLTLSLSDLLAQST